MEEPKGFSKTPGSYHWALAIFIYLFIYAFVHLFIYLFIHLFIYLFIYLFFDVNKFLLASADNNFKTLDMQEQSPRDDLLG